jgi:hypothetical protein
MDWLQFTAVIIGHVAWPFVVIVLLIVLRKRLGALADRLQEFSFGGAKITLEKNLQQGAAIIEQIPVAAGAEPSAIEERDRGPLQNLAMQSPEGAIIMAYIEIERRLRDISKKLGKQYVNFRATVQELIKRGVLDSEASALFQLLNRGRNSAAHGENRQLTTADAYEYIRQAEFLTILLENAEDRI